MPTVLRRGSGEYKFINTTALTGENNLIYTPAEVLLDFSYITYVAMLGFALSSRPPCWMSDVSKGKVCGRPS